MNIAHSCITGIFDMQSVKLWAVTTGIEMEIYHCP